MVRRILIGLGIVLLIAVVVTGLVIRQLVFGGTPVIHHPHGQATTTTTPCATVSAAAGEYALVIDSQQSSASYQATFLVAGQAVPGTVTGVTGDVSGEFVLATQPTTTIQTLKVVVGLRSLDSGAPERDRHVRDDTLETDKYPFATLVASDVPVLTGSYTSGQSVRFTLTGQLTLHGVTRTVSFDVQGTVSNTTVTGTATAQIRLEEFAMRPPQTTAVVSITVNHIISLSLHFTAHQEPCTHLVAEARPA